MISRIYCLLCLIFILSAVPNATSQEVELYKRRIGMRLPNMVHLKPLVRKRRIGMRLPNIIYMRSEPAKKNIWELPALPDKHDKNVISDTSTRDRRELMALFTPFWMTSRLRANPTLFNNLYLNKFEWQHRNGKTSVLRKPWLGMTSQ
ncbi:hypothetical protein V3C99_000137 [Haemonchus contortus]